MKNLRLKLFPLSLTRPYYLRVTLLVFILALVCLSVNIGLIYHQERTAVEEKLSTAASLLGNLLDNPTMPPIPDPTLPQTNRLLILNLNRTIQPALDRVATAFPGIDLGYYDLALDSIAAISPGFDPDQLRQIPVNDSFYRSLSLSQKAFISRTNPAHPGLPVLSVTHPYYRNEQLTGYIWASTGMNLLYVHLQRQAASLLLLTAVAILAGSFLVWFLSRQLSRDLEAFAFAADGKREFSADILPELSPLLSAIRERTLSLAESEERFRKVVNASPSLISLRRLADRRFIDVNDSFLHLSGYTRAEVIGRTPEELSLQANASAPQLRLVTESGQTYLNQEIMFRAKSGQIRTGLSSTAITELSGEPVVVTVTHDITDLRIAEQELARLDRLNLVGEMAASITHEVRNPLTTVRGFLQLLEEKDRSQENREFYTIMIDELDRANTIISEFLSLARTNAPATRVLNLNTAIQTILPLLSANAVSHSHGVSADFGEIASVVADEREIRQLLLNLARNGLEAMADGGCLHLRTFQDGEHVVLTVADAGPGIDPAVLAKLGQPFISTKEGGTGLGMAVCYRIAARHNAFISVDTGPAGTTFAVRFPAFRLAGRMDRVDYII